MSNDTGTYTTPGSQKSLTLADLERAADLVRCMPPEPFGQWMRSQGCPPGQWMLVLPKSMMADIGGPMFLPDYVSTSSALDKPVLLRKGTT